METESLSVSHSAMLPALMSQSERKRQIHIFHYIHYMLYRENGVRICEQVSEFTKKRALSLVKALSLVVILVAALL